MTSENESNITEEVSSNDNEVKTKEEKEIPMTMDTNHEEGETNIPSSEETNTPKEKEDNEQMITTESENDKSDTDIASQSVIIEGKRSRKPTVRLEISDSQPAKKDLVIPQGHGKPLGEIEYINYQIAHASTDTLSRMRVICFGRRGNKATIRKNLREFHGFEFDRDSAEYQKNLNNLIKLKKDQLKAISHVLGFPSTGRNTEHAERILNFLLKPVDEGRKIPGKKSSKRNKSKKRSTNSKDSIDKDKEKVENGSDYNFKPGKKSSNKRSSDEENSPNNKRKKDDIQPNGNEEIVKTDPTEPLITNLVEN